MSVRKRGARQDVSRKASGKKCDANKTKGGGTCGHAAGWGTSHPGHGRCKWHGGCTPTHVKSAEAEIAEQAVETYGLPREIDALEALIEEVQRTAGHVRWLELKVHALSEAELPTSVYPPMYRQERRHGLDVYRSAIGAGIAEREVRIAEQTGALIAQVITGVLKDLGVADRPDVPAIVRKHLMVVDGGKAA